MNLILRPFTITVFLKLRQKWSVLNNRLIFIKFPPERLSSFNWGNSSLTIMKRRDVHVKHVTFLSIVLTWLISFFPANDKARNLFSAFCFSTVSMDKFRLWWTLHSCRKTCLVRWPNGPPYFCASIALQCDRCHHTKIRKHVQHDSIAISCVPDKSPNETETLKKNWKVEKLKS